MKRLISLFTVLVVILLTTGCIAQKTLPSRVQSGDVVYINLGGVKRNFNNAPPSLSQISATITSAADGIPRQLKLIKRFNLFPSYVSKYQSTTLAGAAINGDPIQPSEGAFYVIAQLVDSGGNPLVLPAGSASISITAAGLDVSKMSGYDGDLTNIPVEILPGYANAEDVNANAGSYDFYASGPHRLISPSDISQVNGAYGMTVKLSCTHSSVANATNYNYRLVPVSHDPDMILTQKSTVNGTTKIIEANLINPAGFKNFDDPAWKAGVSTPSDLRLAIIRVGSLTVSNCSVIDSAASYLIDSAGNKIQGSSVSLGAYSSGG